ncbi:MAG: adenylate/guanylate cyclase domain-containing protein [Rhizobiaceae bacterium]
MKVDAANRRLGAVLAADVVGYSQLMGADQSGTIEDLRQMRADLFDPTVVHHRGTIIKRMGDGWIVEFPSISDAAACAIAIQEHLSDHATLKLRIGIHIGEIVTEGDDFFGEGINVAARLEPLANAGSIAISDTAHNSLDGKLAKLFSGGESHNLKNIDRPVSVWTWPVGRNHRPNSKKPAGTPRERPAIAVLPFQNMSGDPEKEFFSDGITEELVMALSKIRDFFVTDRSTTFALKGSQESIQAIAEKLAVRYVLQGSVRAAGNRIRVSAQLIDAGSGTQIWNERYDRELDDIFEIQDEVTASLVGCLAPELYAAEHARLLRSTPQSLDAWECFIRALHLYGQQSRSGSEEAITLLEQAIELDQNYSQALGLFATVLTWRAIQRWEPFDESLEKAKAAADRAILADTNDPWASIGKGYVSTAARDSKAAIMNYGRAVDLSPNFAYAHSLLGVANAYAGNAELGLEHINKAMRLSPQDTFIDKFYLYRSVAHFQAGNYVEVIAAASTAIELKPEHASSYMFLTAAYALEGELELAQKALKSYVELVPNAKVSVIEGNVAYTTLADRKHIAEGLALAGLE